MSYIELLSRCPIPRDFVLHILDLELKNIRTTLLDSNWFYNMLGMALNNTRTTLLNLDLFYDILDLDLKINRTV